MTGARTGGAELYALLPEIYRTRDDGDLRDYLDAAGGLLDLLRGVLAQQLADASPADPGAQTWTLPYAAELLGVRLVSPDEEGQRLEIANAIRWRQRKGTLAAAHSIAVTLGRFGTPEGAPNAARIQEGFRRVAITPSVAGFAERPAATVDLRRPLATPGTFRDTSRRTPDLRAPSFRLGHAHPGRVLIFHLPFPGFFPPGWDAALKPLPTGVRRIEGVVARGDTTLGPLDGTLELVDCIIDGRLTVRCPEVRLVRSAVKELRVTWTGGAAPAVDAEDCLFDELRAARAPGAAGSALARLVGVTVLSDLRADRYEISDTLLAGEVRAPSAGADPSCFRYSRLPPALSAASAYRCPREEPRFFEVAFGQPACGVLHPGGPAALREGAEDGGELGAYHHRRHAQRERAVLDKLAEALPLGQIAVLIPDSSLADPTP